MKVAVVGGGPRGLWAVEELLTHCVRLGTRPEIDVWEPLEPGTGWVYRSGQPEYWRLNVDPGIVQTHLGSFLSWHQDHYGPVPAGQFPARCVVGQFLSRSWQHLCDTAATHGITVRHHHMLVDDIARDHTGTWEIHGHRYQRVLLTTGHHATWPGALLSRRPRPVPAVHAALDLAALESIPAGASVLARGAALTFIDAALALTIGRGGRFCITTDDGAMQYTPSGQEPQRLLPVTRSGRFMLVKPALTSRLKHPEITDALSAVHDQVAAAASSAALADVLAGAADTLLQVAGAAPAPETIRALLTGQDACPDPVAELRGSWRVAVDAAPPDAAWAVGEAWRQLYPAIIARVSHGSGCDPAGFHTLARRMERIAFGPIPDNAARLLALIDHGLVDTALLDRPEAVEDALDSGHVPIRGTDTAIDVVVDAVLAPSGPVPGSLPDRLLERYGGPDAGLGRGGTVLAAPTLALIGRSAEHHVLGNDTLNRSLHDEIDHWAERTAAASHARDLDRGAHGMPPLTGRLEPWMTDLLRDPGRCAALVATYGSPVNVHHTERFTDNAAELVAAGRAVGVDTRIFFARKANKSLAFVDAARAAGHGVDVASHRELDQVLRRGVAGPQIILSAAIKPDPLLRLAVDNEVTISVDSRAELHRIAAIAAAAGAVADVAPRLAPDPGRHRATRFGEILSRWTSTITDHLPSGIRIRGVHLHLHGYAAADRAAAIGEALELVDTARAVGHDVRFVDIGGGVPMSYLDDPDQWHHFHHPQRPTTTPDGRPLLWNGVPLGTVYPFHQQPTRGRWLTEILTTPLEVAGTRDVVSAHLTGRGLRLHLEPGRALLDGCGLILARVAFVKQRSDGETVIGVEMNRTQCRTTSDDILVDPIRVATGGGTVGEEPSGDGAESREANGDRPAVDGFLVGAYCIEDEIIIKRRIRFPRGIGPGDLVAIPNTAGYFMHILESASHQIPLARNIVLNTERADHPDDIDREK